MLGKIRRHSDNIVTRIYAMKIMSSFWFIYPLQTIMFGERGGVDAAGVGVLIGAGTLLTIAFEIPTGILADKISRKHAIVYANLSLFLQVALWLVWPNFTGYMIGVVFAAFGKALESGSIQAYLYAELPSSHRKQFGKIWARANGIDLFGFAFASLLTTLVGVNYELVLAMTIAAALATVAISLTLPTDDLTTSEGSQKPAIFKSALSHIVQSRDLNRLLMSAVVMVAMASYVNEFLGLYYSQVGVSTRWLPALFGVGSIIGGLTFWTLHAWEGFLNRHNITLTVVTLILFALSRGGNVVIATLGMYTVLRLARLLQVQFDSNVQHLSSDEARATIASIGSFGAKTIAGIVSIAIGFFAVDEQILQPVSYSIFIGGICFIAIQFILRKRDKKST